MSEATQLTQISDNVNQGYIAGRDLYLGDQYAVQETLYFEPDLKDVEPPAWPILPKARELVRNLATQRLIILAGQDLDDKTLVARHLAWLLRQELHGEVRVREWYRSSDPQKIETAFHETATTLLLLPQILPHHIGHRLGDLSRLLHVRRNYAVITTEGRPEEWGIESGSPNERFWCEVSWETYYGRSFLSDLLQRELGNELRPVLTETLSVEEIAARLKQPERIRQFAQWLSSQDQEISPERIQSQIDQLGGDSQAISLWYRQLERNEQLLALGLVLFDGLPDDQIFAALEILVNRAWRETDPNLPLFDYHDLQHLGAYFHLVDVGEDGARIETSSRQKGDAILLAAWKFQRRRLLTTLPAITRMIKGLTAVEAAPEEQPAKDKKTEKRQSALTDAGAQLREALKGVSGHWRFTQGPERELYSSQKRVHQLQRAVIESLSRIGVLSFEAVEAAFLDLAVEGSTGFQTVVAKALAAWRGSGHTELLFRILRAWWADGCSASSVQSLAQRTVRKGLDPFIAMRATVALAVGYAVQYDPPNLLAPALIGLIEALALDRNPLVRRHVLELTLPIAVSAHLKQIEGLLRAKLLFDEDQMYAVAFGISMAYSQRPLEALEVINRWHAIARSQEAQNTGGPTLLARERLLATVCLAYGYTRCSEGDGTLSPGQIITSLQSILTSEKHPYIRRHALFAMGLQAVHSFELASPMMLELISDITLSDRHQVITVFAHAYLHQREALTGGDGVVEIDGREFATWNRSQRPLTAIEESLYAWLKDESHPVAQQVAAQTLAVLATTELERRERSPVQGRQEAWPQTAQGSPVPFPTDSERVHRLHPLGRLALFAAMPKEKEIRSQMWPLTAQVIEIQQQSGTGSMYHQIATSLRGKHAGPSQVQESSAMIVPLVLHKWLTFGDESVSTIARRLGRALDMYRYRWLILTLILVISMAACNVLLSLTAALFRTSSPPAAQQPATSQPLEETP